MLDIIPPIQIEARHWQIVQAILQAHVPDCEVWAFGSHATHTAERFSDLDLAVLCATPLPLQRKMDLKTAFSESDLPWSVDIIDWHTTTPDFQAIIAEEKVLIQP